MEYFEYALEEKGITISSLAGMATIPLPDFGSFVVKTDKGMFGESDGVFSVKTEGADVTAIYTFFAGLEVIIRWKVYPDGFTGRTDTVKNTGAASVAIYGYYARTGFAGSYRCYTQANFWTKENQGYWAGLTHGVREIGNHGGRSCLGSTPYMALQNNETGGLLAVHLFPGGDWSIRTEVWDETFMALSAGPAQTELAYALVPGESVEFSRLVFQALPGGTIESGIAPLQRFLLNDPAFKTMKPVPVEFNTWFYDFDNLNEDELLKELDAAAALGCEVFTIDAGWYGCLEGRWWNQAGDWREKQDAAFRGKMASFAEKVRAKGLAFGIWIEPERFGREVPIVKEHPQWFLPDSDGAALYPDLENPEAAEYVFNMICEIINRYGAGWVKIDFNHILGRDPRGKAHYGYLGVCKSIMDRIRGKYPALLLECCASGGFRQEAEMQRHFDTGFVSDSVNPFDVLRICEGAALRSLTGTALRWACFYNGGALPWHGRTEKRQTVLVPKKAVWDDTENVDPDFCLKVCLEGQLSFSGQIAGLDGETKKKMKKAVDFFKTHRQFIQYGIREQLTPIEPVGNRNGWVAFYLHNAGCTEGLLFAFRLDSVEKTIRFRLPREAVKGSYRIQSYDTGETFTASPEELCGAGIALEIPEKNRGVIFCFQG
jgi:hypothetical protein